MNVVPAPLRFAPSLLALMLSAVALPALAADGDPDLTFSTDGQTTYTISSPAVSGERASAVLALPDGELLIGGSSWGGAVAVEDFAVVKYQAGGTPDLGFGSLGSRVVDLGASDSLEALFREADGRLMLAGRSGNLPAFARLTAAGDLDGTFGGGGTLVVDPPWGGAEIVTYERTARRSAASKYLFAGRCRLCPANDAFRPFVARFHADGAPDTGFDGDGWAVLPMDLGANPRIALDLDASGRPVAAVESAAPVAIWRLTSAGAPDPAWGGDGRVDTAFTTGNPFQLIVEPAGTRLYLYGAYAVRAVLPGGGLDASFGNQGVTYLGAWDEDSWVRHFALQTDGKLVGVGGIDPVGAGLADFFLIRLGLDGEPDPTFHGNGVRRIPFDLAAGAVDIGEAITFSGGKPVAVGFATEGDGDERWAILRSENALIFADGFERGSTAGWAGY